MEEERARQEAAAKKAREESSKTESEGQSSTSNVDIVMADTEPEPNSYTEDERLLHMVC
jgi:26S proteasome regulatory subunit N10